MTELLNFAGGQGEYLRRLAGETARQLYSRPSVQVISHTTGQFHAALELYLARPDQAWSIVDCARFIVMNDRGIHGALAFDHHPLTSNW